MPESSEYRETCVGIFAGSAREFVKKPKFTFQVSEPRYGDEGWEVTATMDVVTELGEPVSGRIQYYLNGSPKGDPVALDADGRATMRPVNLPVGKHLLEAKFLELPAVHGRKEFKIEFKISVDVSEAALGDEGMEATATAYVSAGDLPVKDIEGRFFLDEQPAGAPKRTGDDGRVTQKFINLTRGTRTVTFLVSGTTIRVRKSFDVKEERVKVPAKLSVSIAGTRGQQQLLIMVSADDGSPVRGLSVAIQDGGKLKSVTTGSNGMATYQLEPFQLGEKSRFVRVRAGNELGLFWSGRLLGP